MSHISLYLSVVMSKILTLSALAVTFIATVFSYYRIYGYIYYSPVNEVDQFVKYGSDLKRTTHNILPTSVWCYLDGGEKMCTFKNLCYSPKGGQFLFVLMKNSVISGLSHKSEFQTLELSSILNHNSLKLKIAIISAKDKILKTTVVRGKSVFILWRFKWDNIMHVIHDDLLPLYFTYEHICHGDIHKCASLYQLAFADGGDLGPLYDWYKLFSHEEPLLLHNVGDNVICFNESRTGLTRTSTWFQYGFGEPQGPIKSTSLEGSMLRRFTKFVIQSFNLSQIKPVQTTDLALLFSRKINRKIINENEVIDIMQNSYQRVFPQNELLIVKADLSTNDTKSILSSLLQSKVVVGMHGSAMILNMFLNPGSAVVELFPFGIDPEAVSPLKAMCKAAGVDILYRSWQNRDESSSVVHPDALPLLGGINHLPRDDRDMIKSLGSIPALPCCHHPAYLYRMFQDTTVHAGEFSSTFGRILADKKSFSIFEHRDDLATEVWSQWYFPAQVGNITCHYSPENNLLTVMWDPAVNVEGQQAWYKLAFIIGSNLRSFTTAEPQHEMQLPECPPGGSKLSIWVKCAVNDVESIDSYSECYVDL